MDVLEIKGKINTAIYKWQQGTAMPTIDNLLALAMIFGVSMDDIIVTDTTDTRVQISA